MCCTQRLCLYSPWCGYSQTFLKNDCGDGDDVRFVCGNAQKHNHLRFRWGENCQHCGYVHCGDDDCVSVSDGIFSWSEVSQE